MFPHTVSDVRSSETLTMNVPTVEYVWLMPVIEVYVYTVPSPQSTVACVDPDLKVPAANPAVL